MARRHWVDFRLGVANILIVCTGNICRSPMAQGFLRHLLGERGLGDVTVESAGVSAWADGEATPEAIEALRELGIDISDHRARRLRRSMIEAADLVIGMAIEHRDAVVHLAPGAASRTFTLKELAALLEGLNGAWGADPTEALRAGAARGAEVRALPDRPLLTDEDVADPLGLGLESFRATAWELGELSERLVASVFGPAPAGQGRGAPIGGEPARGEGR